MNSRGCFEVLSLLLMFALCTQQLFAQAKDSNQEKTKRTEVKTDLGNPAQLAQPTEAERLKAERIEKQLSQRGAQPLKSSAQLKQHKEKPVETQTVRGSKGTRSRLTRAEMQKLQQLQLQSPSPKESK